VSRVQIFGGQYALRIWVDPNKLAKLGVTATEVINAIQTQNNVNPAGQIGAEPIPKGQQFTYTVRTQGRLVKPEEFGAIILRANADGSILHLSDVARVELGDQAYAISGRYNQNPSGVMAVYQLPGSNAVQTAAAVNARMKELSATFPPGISYDVPLDTTKAVSSGIHEIVLTLLEALGLVVVVVFIFLQGWRATLIPLLAVPVSLIGTFIIFPALGFSINTLSLFGLVLAIGLVVDDAIIVVENVNRHMEEGKSPTDAALLAARELAGPIIAMTIVLVAVYVPIGFQSGLTGALFTEFAFTMVGAVTVSAVIALTLSPMMCSKLLQPPSKDRSGWQERFTDFIDRYFNKFRDFYLRWLERCLNNLPVVAVFAALVLTSIYFLALGAHSELAPQEDEGAILGLSTAASNSTLQQRQIYSKQAYQTFEKHKETSLVFQIDAPGQTISVMVLKPWDQRSQTSNQLESTIQEELNQIAGEQVVVFQPPPLPGSNGLPVQFVLTTTQPFDELNKVSAGFIQKAIASGNFIFLNTDLKYDQPESTVVIDRNKTAQLGLTMSNVGAALSSMLGGGYVNYFDLSQRSYKVIPQVLQAFRLNTQQLLDYPIASTASGIPISLSTIATITNKTVPESINHFQQLNSATIQGVPVPGKAAGDVFGIMHLTRASSVVS